MKTLGTLAAVFSLSFVLGCGNTDEPNPKGQSPDINKTTPEVTPPDTDAKPPVTTDPMPSIEPEITPPVTPTAPPVTPEVPNPKIELQLDPTVLNPEVKPDVKPEVKPDVKPE